MYPGRTSRGGSLRPRAAAQRLPSHDDLHESPRTLPRTPAHDRNQVRPSRFRSPSPPNRDSQIGLSFYRSSSDDDSDDGDDRDVQPTPTTALRPPPPVHSMPSFDNGYSSVSPETFSAAEFETSSVNISQTSLQLRASSKVDDQALAKKFRMDWKLTITSGDDLPRLLARRQPPTPQPSPPLSSLTLKSEEPPEEMLDETKQLVSRMFGSPGGRARHSGVVFRDLTVRGLGLGATLQPTMGEVFLGLPRLVKKIMTRGPSAAFAGPPQRDIISGFDGCVRPGELLLVLGRPGAGCSTFLKAFGNQRLGFESVSGSVTYGGTDSDTMAKRYRGEVIYNPEEDLHYASLSVQRTLEFALQSRPPKGGGDHHGSRSSDTRELLTLITRMFGIEHTLGTKVGNEFIRGVSGGEKKRVSIAEAMITRASVQGWDNSSRGLDASTALEYIRSLRVMTSTAGISTAASLYQAGEQLYDLADKVLLIDDGKCLYFGPADTAREYFIGLGFEYPERWTTADFLTSVSDKHKRRVRPGCEHFIPQTSNEFADAYKQSDIYRENLKDMADFERETKSLSRKHGEATSLSNASSLTSISEKVDKEDKNNYALPFHQQVAACTKRQALIMAGDRASLLMKWIGVGVQGLIVGSLAWKLPDSVDGAFVRGGALYFLLLYNSLMAMAELSSFFPSKSIMLKHKAFSFYRPAAYAISQVVLDVPLVLMQVLIFLVCIYFMAGLAHTASQFFIALAILWLSTMITYAFFRAIAAACETFDVATAFTGLALQIITVYTGFPIPPNSMRPGLGWLRWVDWAQYGFECLMANEFHGRQMECVTPYLVPDGPGVSSKYQSCTLQGSRAGETTVDGDRYIDIAFSYSRSRLWRNFGILWAFFFFFCLAVVVAMELNKPNAGGAALTVFKRGQVPEKVEEAIEYAGRDQSQQQKLPDTELSDMSMSKDSGLGIYDSNDNEQTKNTLAQVARNDTIFTFRNINYTIPYNKDGARERKLLQDVQGYVRPGRLTALMGASGAGKTTLLNALAQRLNTGGGTLTGEFLVDGRPLPNSFQRAIGFAEQGDIHEPTATVMEALQFSALLRQPHDVPRSEKLAYCETVLNLLEMQDIAGATIGQIGQGLNQEQRKRLTIGVELAAKPELLVFLDEPTSGLDSTAAFNIVRFLRKLADAGQAILCTIHQPSAMLFENFDELLLLQPGGRVVYNGPLGPDSQDLIGYFINNGAPSCPANANPAEYILEAIGTGDSTTRNRDWADVWAASPQQVQRSREIDRMIASRQHISAPAGRHDKREYATTVATQTAMLVRRTVTSHWRSPEYIMSKFMLHIVAGLFNCLTFWKPNHEAVEMQNRLFSVFIALTVAAPLMLQLQSALIASRTIFQSRENKAKIYSWLPWIISVITAEVPPALLGGSLYFFCWWWGVFGTQTSGFITGYSFLLFMIFELWYVSFGQAVATISSSELLASLLSTVLFLIVSVFCGVFVPPRQIPDYWRTWLYRLSPFTYLIEGFVGAVTHDVPVRCADSEFARFSAPKGLSCHDYVAPYIKAAGGYVQTDPHSGICEFCQYSVGDEFAKLFGISYHNIWRDLGIMCAFVVFNYGIVLAGTWVKFRGRAALKSMRG